MIFSLNHSLGEKILFKLPGTDVFCFFHSENSIVVPGDQWVNSLCASLKLKRNVLVLEVPLELAPELNLTQRWQIGEGFLWLTPRSMGVFFEAAKQFSGSYTSVKAFLSTSK